MAEDVIALEMLFALYALFFIYLIWTSPPPRNRSADHPSDPFPGPLLTDPVDVELQRILDGDR